ncbi:MarR family transcriptional regulator, partial [Arthrobacter deserti]|nr:MarR family transcriptional regulator [Arthrobacter deserti]
RRALILRPTEHSDGEVRATLSDMHARMIAVAESLSDDEAEVVASFLRRMRDAVDGIGDGSSI